MHSNNPNPDLMERVHGNRDQTEFWRIGVRIAMEIQQALLRCNASVSKILDFGCGCGRVLLPLSKIFKEATIHGSDIDQEAIAWLHQSTEEELKSRIEVNAAFPPTRYETNTFDFCYAISVFTHLPPDMQDCWMREFQRILRQGGLLLLTTQPIELILPHLSAEERHSTVVEGMIYKKYGVTLGLPDFYQATWHTSEWVTSRWASTFETVEFVHEGIAGHQDLTMLRKL
jgi:ubiquinone/menaquinone biosynthesis C-methylase UbiE